MPVEALTIKKASKEHLHPVSLLGKVGGVDSKQLEDYYREHPDQIGDFLRGSPYAGFHSFRLNKELQGVDLPEELEYLRDWFLLYYSTPHKNEFIINMTGETGIDGTNVEDVSRAERIARKRLQQALGVFQNICLDLKMPILPLRRLLWRTGNPANCRYTYPK